MQSWPSPGVPTIPGGAPVDHGTERPADPNAPVLVHDTASGELRPVGPDPVTGDGPVPTARLYVCGITPYDATHLGHAFTYLTFDLLQRAWLDRGIDVHYVQNVTDVDDPLLERATDTGVDWQQLAAEQVQLFRDDMTALRVLPPRNYVGVVEGLPLMTDFMERLREQTYQLDSGEHRDWYFRTRNAPDFGFLSGYDEQQMLSVFAERGGDPDRAGKEDPLDSMIWHLERSWEPAWDSPLGRGRPGWHIECVSIAHHFLGSRIDVQGGGSDLVFPHHEMCAAQARAATGEIFAQNYVHVGMVGLDGEKMSKSRGNLVFVSKLREQGVDPMAIRVALLEHHYRQDWMWTEQDLPRAERRIAAWREAIDLDAALDAGPTIEAVRSALRRDLDAATAMAAVDAWASASIDIDGDDPMAGAAIADALDALLGVRLDSPTGGQ